MEWQKLIADQEALLLAYGKKHKVVIRTPKVIKTYTYYDYITRSSPNVLAETKQRLKTNVDSYSQLSWWDKGWQRLTTNIVQQRDFYYYLEAYTLMQQLKQQNEVPNPKQCAGFARELTDNAKQTSFFSGLGGLFKRIARSITTGSFQKPKPFPAVVTVPTPVVVTAPTSVIPQAKPKQNAAAEQQKAIIASPSQAIPNTLNIAYAGDDKELKQFVELMQQDKQELDKLIADEYARFDSLFKEGVTGENIDQGFALIKSNLKKLYFKLSLLYHPDKHQGKKTLPFAEQMFRYVDGKYKEAQTEMTSLIEIKLDFMSIREGLIRLKQSIERVAKGLAKLSQDLLELQELTNKITQGQKEIREMFDKLDKGILDLEQSQNRMFAELLQAKGMVTQLQLGVKQLRADGQLTRRELEKTEQLILSACNANNLQELISRNVDVTANQSAEGYSPFWSSSNDSPVSSTPNKNVEINVTSLSENKTEVNIIGLVN